MATAQEDLLTYCRWDYTEDAIKILNAHGDLDLIERDGIVFIHATKHSNPKLLEALLKYYEKYKLQGDPYSTEYKIALSPFIEMLTKLETSYDLKEKGVDEVLEPYLSSYLYPEEKDKEVFIKDGEYENDYCHSAPSSPQDIPEFGDWPNDLSPHHRDLNGRDDYCSSPEVY